MTTKETEEILKWDAEHLIHGATPIGKNQGILIDKAKGVTLYDCNGKGYIDAASQLTCVNLGYAYNNEIAAVVAEHMARLPYSTLFFGIANLTTIECGKRLAGLLPEGLDHFCFTSGGSESTETAFKLARLYWSNKGMSKYKIVSLYDSYHGMSFGSMSATGAGKGAFHKGVAPMVPGFIHIPSYYCYRCTFGKKYPECDIQCAKFLEEVIEKEGPETVAAFIAEPELGTSGMIPPPPEYWPMVREICTKYDVLLIADEVMTGFGRTGKAFAIEHWGIKPDIMAMAKGISSAYLPFGAVAVNDNVYDGLEGSALSTFTYSGHPVCAAVASKVMQIYIRDKVFENAANMGKYAMERLKAQFLPLPCVGEVSGLGLMIGIEIVADKATGKPLPPGLLFTIQAQALQSGLFIRVADSAFMSGSRVGFSPPLVITKKELDGALDMLYPILANLG